METTELGAVQVDTPVDGPDSQMRELHDFQLSLVGGGIGEVIVG
jgi:hypothetical protein